MQNRCQRSLRVVCSPFALVVFEFVCFGCVRVGLEVGVEMLLSERGRERESPLVRATERNTCLMSDAPGKWVAAKRSAKLDF